MGNEKREKGRTQPRDMLRDGRGKEGQNFSFKTPKDEVTSLGSFYTLNTLYCIKY